MTALTLKIELFSEWHAGTGRGAGPGVDLSAHRDWRGLPCLPGRTVQGLLRDAWRERADYAPPEQRAILLATGASLFGEHTADRPGADCAWGCLDVRDAMLAADVAAWLVAKNTNRIAPLFRVRKSTTIEDDRKEAGFGTARPKSLRTVEVVVPVTMFATLRLLTPLVPAGLSATWPDDLRAACSLVRGLGLRRSRGLGRCQLTLEKQEASP